MKDSQKIGKEFVVILVAGLILSIGLLAWSRSNDLPFEPVSGEAGAEPSLTTLRSNDALSTVVPGQTSNSIPSTNTLQSNLLASSGDTTSSNGLAAPEDSAGQELIATRPANPAEESGTGITVLASDRTSTDLASTQTLSEESVEGTVATPSGSLPVSMAALTPNPTEGLVGTLPAPPGREAPETITGPLQFQRIRIFSEPETSTFAGRANMKNMGNTFLNGLVISWTILGEADQVFAEGELTWPNLAPGETATIQFKGTEAFVDSWVRIEFDYSP